MDIKASPGLKIGDWYSLSAFWIVGHDERMPVEYPRALLYTGQSIQPHGYDVFLSRYNKLIITQNDEASSLERIKIPKERFNVEDHHVKTDEVVWETVIFSRIFVHEKGTVRYLERCEQLLNRLPPSLERECLLMQVKESLYKDWSHTIYGYDADVTLRMMRPDLVKKALKLALDDLI